jgi:hypothetical protein
VFNIFDKFTGDDENVPEPGTEPTYDALGRMTDPGNPWIGWPDPKNPRRTIPASGAQRRRARRAQERREAAERRVGQRAYDRGQAAIERAEAQARVRRRTITGGFTHMPTGLARNVLRDEVRRQKAGDPEIAAARQQDHRDELREARLDRAEERRIRRFKEGRPRGKDLREETFKQFSYLLPTSYWQPTVDEALKAAQNEAESQ